MSTASIRQLSRTLLTTGPKPAGTAEFLDREEGNLLTGSASAGAQGRVTPVTRGEVEAIADLFDRRHVVKNGPYQGPTTRQSPVPAGAVAMDVGAEERLWVFLQRHNAPVAELKPMVQQRINEVLMRVRLSAGTAVPAESLTPRMRFVLDDDGQGNVRSAFIHPQNNDFILESAASDGSKRYQGPLSMGQTLPRFEDASRLPQFSAERAVTSLTGTDVDLSAATFRRHEGDLAVSFNFVGARFRVVSAKDGAGNDVVSKVDVVELKKLVDTTEGRRLQRALRDAGVSGPEVMAIGPANSTGGSQDVAVVAKDAAGTTRIHTVTTEPTGRTRVSAFAFDDAQAREVATVLIRARGRALADNIGPEGHLEVHARLHDLSAAGLEQVATPADSPVGFDATTEVQFVKTRVLGDQAVFVTFHKATGAVRVEDFN